MLKTNLKERFEKYIQQLEEGYLEKVSKTVHSSTINEQVGFYNLNDLKIKLIAIEEFLNNNPPSTEHKFSNAIDAVEEFYNLKYVAELMKEEIRDILLRIYNIEPLIKKYEGVD